MTLEFEATGNRCRRRGARQSPGIETIDFDGRCFAADIVSRIDLLEAANLADASVRAGSKPGDLRWNHPARDFSWPDASGHQVKMDAYTLLGLAAQFAQHRENIRVGRALRL